MKDDSRVLNIGATVRSGNYWNFTTFMTPVEEFYVRNHYPTPTTEQKPELARDKWRLEGARRSVERPFEIGYDDLLKMPSRTIIATMECHGNGRTLFWEQGGFTGQQVAGGNWVLGAVGQAEWQYVPMSEIFARCGVKPDALTVLFWSGMDGNDIGRPMPYADVAVPRRRHRRLLRDERQSADARSWRAGPHRRSRAGAAPRRSSGSPRSASPTSVCGRALNTKGEVYIGPTYAAPEHGADDEYLPGITAADVKGPMVTWMPPKSLHHGAARDREVAVGSGELSAEERRGAEALAPDGRRCAAMPGPRSTASTRSSTGSTAAPGSARRSSRPTSAATPGCGSPFPWDATAGAHAIETRTTDNAGVSQPEQIPLNTLGMANWSIPKFRIEVV